MVTWRNIRRVDALLTSSAKLRELAIITTAGIGLRVRMARAPASCGPAGLAEPIIQAIAAGSVRRARRDETVVYNSFGTLTTSR